MCNCLLKKKDLWARAARLRCPPALAQADAPHVLCPSAAQCRKTGASRAVAEHRRKSSAPLATMPLIAWRAWRARRRRRPCACVLAPPHHPSSAAPGPLLPPPPPARPSPCLRARENGKCLRKGRRAVGRWGRRVGSCLNPVPCYPSAGLHSWFSRPQLLPTVQMPHSLLLCSREYALPQ